MTRKILIISIALIAIPIAARTQSLHQNFEDVPAIFPAGWSQKNLSLPNGNGPWRQDFGNFTAPEGSGQSSIVVDYTSVAPNSTGTISNWLFTPELTLANGDTLTFRSVSFKSNYYPDRLEVRLSTQGASTDVGTSATSTGDFSQLLFTINPQLVSSGGPELYPTYIFNSAPLYGWKKYTIIISGLPGPVQGRIAFRYFVTDGGEEGDNGSTIGIDDFHYISLASTSLPEVPEVVMNVFPNPASDLVTIETDAVSSYELRLMDVHGQLVYTTEFLQKVQFPLDGFAPGIYFAEITDRFTGKKSVSRIAVR